MTGQLPDDRSQIAIAYQWASRIVTVALEMVLPGLLGYWLDQRFGLKPILTVVGFLLGLVVGMWHLLQMVGAIPDRRNDAADSASSERPQR